MNKTELVARTMTNFNEIDTDPLGRIGVNPLIQAVILFAVTEMVEWLVGRCLESEIDEGKLRRLGRWALRRAAKSASGIELKMDCYALEYAYGSRLTQAVIMTRKGLKYQEMKELRQLYLQPLSFANSPEFPEGA